MGLEDVFRRHVEDLSEEGFCGCVTRYVGGCGQSKVCLEGVLMWILVGCY